MYQKINHKPSVSAMNKKAIIIANGEFPQHTIPLKKLAKAKFLICCDGALNELERREIIPDIVVGDFDSVANEILKKYDDRIFYNPSQETNDLTKAVEWATENNFKEIVILGATGKRDDHTLANFSLLFEYCKQIKVSMFTDYGCFLTITESTEFESFAEQQVSIFTENTKLKFNSQNLKYPLKNKKLKSLWSGTLNEAIDDFFSLHFKSNQPVIVYQTY